MGNSNTSQQKSPTGRDARATSMQQQLLQAQHTQHPRSAPSSPAPGTPGTPVAPVTPPRSLPVPFMLGTPGPEFTLADTLSSPRGTPGVQPLSISPPLSSPRTGGTGSASASAGGPSEQAARKPTVFHWRGGGKQVYLALAADEWETRLPLTRSSAEFSVIVDLPPGVHHYQFIVDGVWQPARDQPTETLPDGTTVNVMDSRLGETVQRAPRGSPPGDYGCQAMSLEEYARAKEPPALPPQLQSAILNAAMDSDASLPVPAHVVLNHLYSCMRVDGVACLASTQRYRTKYVTTILYTRIATHSISAAGAAGAGGL